jgi:hypothetical protein
LLALARRSATEHGVDEASSALKAQRDSTTLLAEGRPVVNVAAEEEEYVLRLLEDAVSDAEPAPRAVMSTSRSVRHSSACTTTLLSNRFAVAAAAADENGDEGPLDDVVGTLLLLLLPPLMLVTVDDVVASRR